MRRSETEVSESPGRRWTVRDVIDFEHLVDVQGDDPAGVPPADDRRVAFHAWLDAVRPRSATTLPGVIYTRGRHVVQFLATTAGLAIGFGLCGALLSHGDAEPINALMFFALTVGVQLGVLVLVALAWLMRRANVRVQGLQDTTLALVGLFGRALNRLDGDRRGAVRARWAAIDLRSGRLAPLVGCQLLITTQLFAIAFNLGLLAAMLLVHLPFEELRFGWQSTYSFTADGVAAWVRIVSEPWRWISSGLAPDAAEVAVTRYARGQRAETLPADAAHAWWPFLLSSIAFYGLLLRSLIAILAALLLRYRLERLRFVHPAANALWRRIQGPLVTSEGSSAVLEKSRSNALRRPGGGTDVLVLDEDLVHRSAEIRASAERIFHGPIRQALSANIDDDVLGESLVSAIPRHGTSIVVATLASRDPIVAIAGFIRALRARAGPDADLTMLLVADVRDDGAAEVPGERVVIWQRFAGIHRLNIGVERCL